MKWEDPPEKHNQTGATAAIRAALPELEANPGKWALVVERAAASGVAHWKKAFPTLEFRTVRIDGYLQNPAKVYARAKVTDA